MDNPTEFKTVADLIEHLKQYPSDMRVTRIVARGGTMTLEPRTFELISVTKARFHKIPRVGEVWEATHDILMERDIENGTTTADEYEEFLKI